MSTTFDNRLEHLRVKAKQAGAEDPFSRQVLDGTRSALTDIDNPLRITFFATSMRIFFEHLMDNLAPPEKVQECTWFRPENDAGRPTRRQRITYAIQGGFTDKLLRDEFHVDPEPHKEDLLNAVDTLNKHIHGREGTIITEHDEQDRFVSATLDEMKEFLGIVQSCRDAVWPPIADKLSKAVFSELLEETIESIDLLANLHMLDEACVEKIVVRDIGPDEVIFRTTGSLAVTLVHGSASERRRGQGDEWPESFPFWGDISVPIRNFPAFRLADDTECEAKDYGVKLVDYEVDTSKWYE